MSLLMICDMLTRLLNGSFSGRDSVYVKSSKEILSILKELKICGYIEDYSSSCDKKYHTEVFLRYDVNGIPAIRFKRFFSTPSRPIYCKAKDKPVRRFGRFSTVFISTSKGIVASNAFRKPNLEEDMTEEDVKYSLGGLLLFEVGS